MSCSKKKEEEYDEPVTPAGRLFHQQQMEQVINCVVGMKHPIDLESFKLAIKDSIMIQHPRFRSLYIKDKHGTEHWRKLEEVDIDKHILDKNISKQDYDDHEDDDEDLINAYLADLSVSTPLNMDKPLWEIHALRAQKCFILRIHHSLGDGVSLMSLFLTCCRRVGHPDDLPIIPSASSSSTRKKKSNMFKKIWRLIKVCCLTLVYMLKFIVRSLWVKDEKTVIRGGNGVELWPRKLATAKFRLDDMKLVKNAINNA
ncbi:O-acyltransferase wsd1, partial [Thalictrum thalictroides]